MSLFDEGLRDYGDFSKFPIGSRVKVNTQIEDFHFFTVGKLGTVTRNYGRYLSISVKFDQRHVCAQCAPDGLPTFNFNPKSLIRIAGFVPVCGHLGKHEWQDKNGNAWTYPSDDDACFLCGCTPDCEFHVL